LAVGEDDVGLAARDEQRDLRLRLDQRAAGRLGPEQRPDRLVAEHVLGHRHDPDVGRGLGVGLGVLLADRRHADLAARAAAAPAPPPPPPPPPAPPAPPFFLASSSAFFFAASVAGSGKKMLTGVPCWTTSPSAGIWETILSACAAFGGADWPSVSCLSRSAL